MQDQFLLYAFFKLNTRKKLLRENSKLYFININLICVDKIVFFFSKQLRIKSVRKF